MAVKKPLAGIRVVDFTWHFTGPITTRHLADLGAEVIKIESRRRTDIHRAAERTGSFKSLQTSKLSITLNIATPEGLELVKKLIGTADIVVDNFAGGVMRRMGLGYEVLKEIKPDIIMLSSCMQGQTGPHSQHGGSGHKLTALAGFNHITGWPDQPPVWLAAYTDFIAPRFNIIALMAALDYRRHTGKGQFIDMSQYENGVQFVAPLLLDTAVNGRVAEREGNRVPNAAPHNAYRCRGEDRWCAIAVFTDKEWRSFCGVIGSPALADDPRFATLQDRKKNGAELDRLINAWTADRLAEEVAWLMQEAGVAAGIAATGEDMMENDPQLQHRHTFFTLDHLHGPYRATSGARFKLSKCPVEPNRSPLFGEHNEYVFKELLGIPQDEFDRLVAEKIID